MTKRKIGILTSGGDCSGLNSVIRAAYIRATQIGYELLGVKSGLCGLASNNPEYTLLNENICDESLLSASGSILYADTSLVSNAAQAGLSADDIKKLLYAGYKKLGLNGLICIGGDGSLQMIAELLCVNNEMNIIAIPKTIDNDVNGTDVAVGFQTAVDVVVGAIENVITSAKSHKRAIVVEVMGRDAGFIAMCSGLASGAHIILVPEFRYDIDKVKQRVARCFDNGYGYCILVVAESVESEDFKHKREMIDGVVKYTHLVYGGIGKHLATCIKEIGIDARTVTLGHIQRGGRTSASDRILGTIFGVEAVNQIDVGNRGRLLCYVNGKVKAVSIADSLKHPTKSLSKDNAYVQLARQLGVYIGEV
ncbi:MAG: ATP-dependent 6-phosphofructokinase [Holosporales bacterium]|jgi:6-phosphofructokinase 1|nr:ATP-dependent 6-phosphofructokinase [Holosporales bacterium]